MRAEPPPTGMQTRRVPPQDLTTMRVHTAPVPQKPARCFEPYALRQASQQRAGNNTKRCSQHKLNCMVSETTFNPEVCTSPNDCSFV